MSVMNVYNCVMPFTVYRIESPSGKAYVGFTAQTLAERYARHLRQTRHGRQGAIQNAIRKYGDAMKMKALAVFDNRADALQYETAAIKAHNTMSPNGYNLANGGKGGQHFAAESLAKIKASRTPAAMRELSVALHADPEISARRNASIKAHYNTPQGKATARKRAKDTWENPIIAARRRAALAAARDAHWQKVAPLVKRAIEMRAQGFNFSQIARELNRDPATIHNWINKNAAR